MVVLYILYFQLLFSSCFVFLGQCIFFPASFTGCFLFSVGGTHFSSFSRVFFFSCVLPSVWCLLPPVFALDVTVLTVVWWITYLGTVSYAPPPPETDQPMPWVILSCGAVMHLCLVAFFCFFFFLSYVAANIRFVSLSEAIASTLGSVWGFLVHVFMLILVVQPPNSHHAFLKGLPSSPCFFFFCFLFMYPPLFRLPTAGLVNTAAAFCRPPLVIMCPSHPDHGQGRNSLQSHDSISTSALCLSGLAPVLFFFPRPV